MRTRAREFLLVETITTRLAALACLTAINCAHVVTGQAPEGTVQPTASIGSDGEVRIFDVRAYGAMGDGITDDTAAFASTLRAVAKAGGIVQIPAGTYVATLVVATPGITIQGAGTEYTIIKAPNTTAASTAGRIIAIAGADHTTIKNLTIDGNKSGRSGKKPITYALLLYNSRDSTVENLRVIDAGQIGIGLSASKNCKISRCEVTGSEWQNITTLNNKTGGCEGTVISKCRSIGPGYDCIQVTNVGAVTVEECYLAASPFAGVYVATGARNVTLRNNTITKCYTGIDMSFGSATGPNGGPDKSEGNVIAGNQVTLCENIGIGTASNGTVITNNSVSDIGVGAVPTYTLLGQRVAIISGGSGYSVGDILAFVGGSFIKPAQIQVTAVDAGGSVTSIILPNRTTNYYLGVYIRPMANPVSVSGGSGTGATVETTWNARALKYAGIAVVDAANVAITNNRSGNSNGNTAQRYGIAVLRQFTEPSRLTMSGNALSGNTVASVSPLMKASGDAPSKISGKK